MYKKARGPNFSNNEKEILISLIMKNKDVVENKRTDATTTAIKNEGWKIISQEFNSMSTYCVRNTDQLKTCWDNIKRNTRKDKATIKKQTLLTGGGKPDFPPTNPLQGQIETLLGPTLDGLDNPFDSDAQFTEMHCKSIEVIEVTDSLEKETAPASSTEVTVNFDVCPDTENKENRWNGWSPAALKTKMSDTLSQQKRSVQSSPIIQRRRPKTSLHDKLLQSKIELVELMKKNVESEAALKQSILNEQLHQEKIKSETLQLQLTKLKNK